ncbi:MAG TPA: hypothetical protein PLC79_07070 [Phycisphaerae bacterium]|mgnify:CR=1 FL=1|nr:hypothetical protein [Phycisphaerae bacterium]
MIRSRDGLCRPAVVVVLWLSVSVAWGQTRQIQGGNALDANPMVGSGGINFAAPPPPINRANAMMTGNVGRGAAFRGFSPIRDSSQFFINLPSAGLSSFNAQSMSVGALQQGVSNYQPYLYFDPSRTVTDAGGLERRLNVPGTAAPRSPFEYPRERLFAPVPRNPVTYELMSGQQPTGTGLAVEPGIQRVLPAGTSLGGTMRFNERLLASPLFGRTYDVPVSQLREWSDSVAAVPGAGRIALARGAQPPLEAGQPGAIQSPLDRVLGRGPVQVAESPDYSVEARMRAAQVPLPAGQETSLSAAQQPMAAAPSAAQPGAAPEWAGRDRFRDMAAVTQAVREQLLGLGPEATPAVAGGRAPAVAAAWAREYLTRPLTSFAGTSPTAVNEYLRRAEADMRGANYYRAADLYAMAARIDPDSPLPALGQSQALVAAGEYLSAANLLSRAIDTFPGIAYFRIDLTSFIPNPQLLEARRADLERILKQNEDYRLRFLLGYLEYYSGYVLPGLEDLAKAAAKAPPGSPPARFLEMLKQGRSVSPVSGAVAPAVPASQPK